MASYSRLLLSTGGGVISAGQQADQARNTASVLIGLGGTGVHCIRTIKTQVYDRLKPDVPGAAVPTYQHIRFLGVDSADTSKRGALRQDPNKRPDNSSAADQIMPLADNEFFSIANGQIQGAFKNRTALTHRKELAWLDYERISIPDLADAGAGGIRQVGRFMLMDRSESFIAKLQQEIQKAKTGLNSPHVNIHIFSGLSGGTGSGCFLDVCYMVRSIAEQMGAVTIYGYFFLPDVNLWPIPEANTYVRDYIRKNGYASMQELDYCMNLQFNGSGFTQTYQNNRVIPWEGAPVDMCHLICATDENNNAIAQAYDYAMNVTAEYLMDFLTESNTSFDLQQHLSNFRAMINEANQRKLCGYCVDYCVIGAACASVPLREINTYLASELFHQFTEVRTHLPGKGDVEKLCVDALAPGAQTLQEVYNALYRMVQAEADPDAYELFPDDWKFVRDNGPNRFNAFYSRQTEAKKERYEANAKAMTNESDPNSLIGRVQEKLKAIIRDLKRGPIFAHAILASGEDNLVKRIDEWIQQNEDHFNFATRQTKERQRDLDDARLDFEARSHSLLGSFLGIGCKRCFESYEFYLRVYHQHQLELATCEQLKAILPKFRDQVRHAVSDYYVRLSRVTNNLIETFEDNRQALASQTVHHNLEGFAQPMMRIKEIKPVLDAQVKRLDVPNMMSELMDRMIQRSEEWIQEDESRITRLVTDFILDENAFGPFANRDITDFLRDKYEVQTGSRVDDDQLSAYIYDEWIRPRTEAARPLFYFNTSIWQPSQSSKLAFLSYPSSSAPISNAARRRNAEDMLWGLKTSALTDRIFVMSSACGLPLSAYKNCQPYEQMFYSSVSIGRHYYEGKPVPGMAFNNWNKLPSIMPQSVLTDDCSDLPPDLRKSVLEARKLWGAARDYGFLDEDSNFLAYAPADADELRRACDDARTLLDQSDAPDDASVFDKAAERIQTALSKPRIPTGQVLPRDGDRSQEEVIVRVQEDHFVSSPAFHAGLKHEIETVEEAKSLIKALQDKKKTVRPYKTVVNDFCEALFTGVLQWKGRSVTWPGDAFHQPVTLCDFGDEYPYAKIPVYQAYLNYRELPDDAMTLIRTEYQRRYRENAPELRQTGVALKAELSEERLGALAQIAETYDDASKVTRFLRDFVQRFKIFCLDTGV